MFLPLQTHTFYLQILDYSEKKKLTKKKKKYFQFLCKNKPIKLFFSFSFFSKKKKLYYEVIIITGFHEQSFLCTDSMILVSAISSPH